jgi:flagellar assembly protein FliH
MHEATTEFTVRDFGAGPAGAMPAFVAGSDMVRWRLPVLDGPEGEDDGASDGTGDVAQAARDAPATADPHVASSAVQAHGHADARAELAADSAAAAAAQAREQQLDARVAELEAELQALRENLAAAREAAAAEGRAAGFDEGRVAGQATVEREAEAQRARIASGWTAVEAKVNARLTALDARLADAAHELVLALCHTVLRTELSISGAPLQRLIDDVLGGLRQELAGAVVVLHPDDLALLGEVGIATRADPDMARGDVLIRSPGGDIEASLGTRVELAMARLTGEGT